MGSADMSDPTPSKLQDIVQQAQVKALSVYTDEFQDNDGIDKHRDIAVKAIQDLVIEALPEKENSYEETRKIGCIDDDADRGYWLAIDQFKANLKQRGIGE